MRLNHFNQAGSGQKFLKAEPRGSNPPKLPYFPMFASFSH